MLERRSALASAAPYKSSILDISESRGFTLTQVAGLTSDFETNLAAAVGELPAKVGIANEHAGRNVMRIGPSQFWIIAPETDDLATQLQGKCVVTPLTHSRTRIHVSGAPARDVLAKLIPLDLHESVFAVGHFAMTGIHHTPVTVHCIASGSFHIYVMRTFALDVWEAVTDAALEFAAL